MSDKVKLPKDVVEALNRLCDGNEKSYVFNDLISYPTQESITICNFFKGDLYALATALINGYEVEQTPVEQAAEMIKVWESRSQIDSGNVFGQRLHGAKWMLKIFNIDIPGVNLE